MSEWKQLDIEEWISSQGDFHANPIQLQASKTQTTIANSGLKCLELSKKSNPPTSLERMSEILLASEKEWYSNKCVLTWKVKVTKCRRLYYLLQQSTHRTKDTGAGLSELWLTPSATNIEKRSEEGLKKRKKYRESKGRNTVPPGNLAEQVQYGKPVTDMAMWPTPTTKGYGHGSEGQYQMLYKKMIAGEITKKELEIFTATKMENHRSFKKMNKMWPTPTVNDSKNNGGPSQHRRTTIALNAKVGGALNPQWVEWLMGYPIGWTDLKD